MQKIELIAPISDIRLDAFIASQCEELSRSRIETLIKDGAVLLNDRIVSKSAKVSIGDRILVDLPPLEEAAPRAVEMPLHIIYEDDDLLVINKPKGVVVHPAPGHLEDTLVNGLLAHCGESLSGINGEKRPGIVHRIDKDTSGLLVVAKNDAAHKGLSAQFETHSIDREYETIVFGKMPADEGTINAPIGRSQNDRKKMATGARNGKPAVTHYHVLTEYDRFSHLVCRLETGRTHQIRVHLSSIGHFVLGDLVYGRAVPNFNLEFEGQCLHARVLGFDHPITGEHLRFESPLPKYFEKVLTKLSKMR